MAGPTGPQRSGEGEPIRPPEAAQVPLEEMSHEDLLAHAQGLETQLEELRGRLEDVTARLERVENPTEERSRRFGWLRGRRSEQSGDQGGDGDGNDEETRRRFTRGRVIGAVAVAGAVAAAVLFGGGNDKAKDRATNGKAVPEQTAKSPDLGAATSPLADSENPLMKGLKGLAGDVAKAQAASPDEESTPKPHHRSYGEYHNVDTGSDAEGLIGQTSFNVNHEKGSFYNFKDELRKNPQALAFWQTCLESGNVSYESCVGDNALLNKVEARAKHYAAMDAKSKAKHADKVVAMFNGKKFDGNQIQFMGVHEHSGPYRTVATNTNGDFLAATNNRSNDPWLTFKFTDKDGHTKTFHIRECDQMVEAITMRATHPTPNTPPAEGGPEKPAPKGGGKITHPKKKPGQHPKGGGTTGTTQKPGDKPKDECPTGYIPAGDKCIHKPASGPPPAANQAPRPQAGTPGYTPGGAEAIDGTQHGDPTSLDTTPHGTEAGGPGSSPGGGDGSVVTQPGSGAQDNPESTGGASGGTSEGTSDGAGDPQSQTGASGETAGAGSAPGNH